MTDDNAEPGPGEFRCEHCKGVFAKGYTDAEAAAEAVANWGTAEPEDPVLICDPCYQKFRVWYAETHGRELAP